MGDSPDTTEGRRVLDMIDAELARLDDRTTYPPLTRWAFLRRRWLDGVFIARECAAGKLREIRDAYVADALTEEAQALGLYDDAPRAGPPMADSEGRDARKVHRLTGKPMAKCSRCGQMSGLAGIDGGLCLGCSMKGGGWPLYRLVDGEGT